MPDHRETVAAFLLRLRSQRLTDHRILSACEAIPRRKFVPVIHVDNAYVRGQMPIECGQTMTAADQVAKMLSLLQTEDRHRVLELGTGTGYQTALLAHLTNKVTSIERFRTLHEKAKTRHENLNIQNSVFHLADALAVKESWGLFDRIVANFALPAAPTQYLDLLASDGVIIAPIGPGDGMQMLRRHRKVGLRFEVEDLMPVRTQPPLPGVSKAI